MAGIGVEQKESLLNDPPSLGHASNLRYLGPCNFAIDILAGRLWVPEYSYRH